MLRQRRSHVYLDGRGRTSRGLDAAVETTGGDARTTSVVEPSQAAPPVELRPTGTSLITSMVASVAGNVLTLALTVFTGVITARLLGPDGRGEVAAIVAWASTVQLRASVGFKEGVSYLQAKDPASGPRLLGTTFLLIIGLGSSAWRWPS